MPSAHPQEDPAPGGTASPDGIDVGRLRILVAGREYTGKTSALRKICQSSDEAAFNDPENELVHPPFIFHDSGGFEGTSDITFDVVKQFIWRRGRAGRIADRIHGLWYFIRTDTPVHLTTGDEYFFNNNMAGLVPVIVVLTGYSGLLTLAFGLLRKQMGIAESKSKKFEKARELLDSRYIRPLKALRYPPVAFVRMDNSTQPEQLEELIQTTLRELSGQALRPIVLSVRQRNFDACVARVLEEALEARDPSSLVSDILSGVPHVWDEVRAIFPSAKGTLNYVRALQKPDKFNERHTQDDEIIDCRADRRSINGSEDYTLLERNVGIATTTLCTFLHAPTPWTNTKRAEAAAVICICLEQTAIQASAYGPNFPTAFSDAAKAYYASDAPLRVSVNKEISKFSPQDYREPTKRAAAKLAEVIKTHRLRLADD